MVGGLSIFFESRRTVVFRERRKQQQQQQHEGVSSISSSISSSSRPYLSSRHYYWLLVLLLLRNRNHPEVDWQRAKTNKSYFKSRGRPQESQERQSTVKDHLEQYISTMNDANEEDNDMNDTAVTTTTATAGAGERRRVSSARNVVVSLEWQITTRRRSFHQTRKRQWSDSRTHARAAHTRTSSLY
jgi:hypothetical protein